MMYEKDFTYIYVYIYVYKGVRKMTTSNFQLNFNAVNEDMFWFNSQTIFNSKSQLNIFEK